MKVTLMEPTAFGPKMKKMALKESSLLLKMFSGLVMTQTLHGITEGSKVDRPEGENEKRREMAKANAEEEEDSSDQEKEKVEEKEKEKAVLTGERRRL